MSSNGRAWRNWRPAGATDIKISLRLQTRYDAPSPMLVTMVCSTTYRPRMCTRRPKMRHGLYGWRKLHRISCGVPADGGADEPPTSHPSFLRGCAATPPSSADACLTATPNPPPPPHTHQTHAKYMFLLATQILFLPLAPAPQGRTHVTRNTTSSKHPSHVCLNASRYGR